MLGLLLGDGLALGPRVGASIGALVSCGRPGCGAVPSRVGMGLGYGVTGACETGVVVSEAEVMTGPSNADTEPL